MTFISLSVLWIGATLVTDWNSVFYRKAVIYKRRVDEELLEMKKERSTTMSKSVSSNSSNFDADVGMTNKRTSLGARQSLNFRSTMTKGPEPNFGPPPEIGPIDT